ncbi:hydrogenase formation protein HypD [Paraburkholderia aromaticivorans]|uniref:hydrogenase formation protein HypD n=1 Tax=Paraburkholderia aromaticivorans TaxID=2026199 RepID=UPI00268EA145
MKYVDEFRDPHKAKTLAREIRALVARIERAKQRPLQIMEVCGGHTHTIFRYGIQQLLPDAVEFVHGPGCPVCVLPMGRVDDCVALAERADVIFTTFGDAMRVPGSKKSLLKAKADGADVRMVYSPLDALKIAQLNPEREVIFFGLGFETTMPSTAMTVLQAHARKIKNFSLFCNHITIIPTIKAILDSPDLHLDGFLGPGHVSMVIGTRPYEFIARHYRKPITVAGFEPLDVMQSLWMVLRQIADGRCEVENQYGRVVPEDGNAQALAAVVRVFETREFFEWRGLGSIDHSGVRVREAFAEFDAERKFAVPNLKIADPKACQCGEVLKGVIKPHQCKVFGTACTPESPLGSLMVSSEGACAAYYNYGRIDTSRLDERRNARQAAAPAAACLGAGGMAGAAMVAGAAPIAGTVAIPGTAPVADAAAVAEALADTAAAPTVRGRL